MAYEHSNWNCLAAAVVAGARIPARRTVLLRLAALILVSASAALAQQHWWEREPLRIIDLTTSIGRIDFRPPADVAARKAALGYNAEHFDVMAMAGGLDDQGFYFVSQAAGRVNADYLRPYVEEAHKRGIRVMIYFNVHWYTMAFGARHPEWQQIRENGQPLDKVYDTGTDFCVNSGWREWCFRVLRDLAAYPIDGIFYDGPVYRPDTCYCSSCRKKFGRELPSKRKRQGAAFQELMQFQAASLADFLRDSRKVLKTINPEIAFYMNGGVRGSNWATGRLNRVLMPEQDLLGSEGGFISGDLTRVPLWKPGLTARLLESQAGGKPRVIFSAASHKPWTFSILPAAELRLLYADSIANAASVWFGITPYEFDQPEMDALTEMNAYQKRTAEYYVNTRSTARAAVVWSDTTANVYAGAGAQLIDVDRVAGADAGNLESEFSGVTEALLRAHVPFDVIDDTTLERDPLDRYTAIFLPNVACMSDRVAARVSDWVRGGGHLFATFESSLYDETGVKRSDFALAKVFGASQAGSIAGPRRWDFVQPSGKSPYLAGLNRDFLPSPAWYVRARTGEGRAVLRFTKPLVGRYDGVPPLSDDPALVEHTVGKGTALYSPGDIGAAIAMYHTPEFLAILGHAARQFAPPDVTLENAPESVELVVRSQGGRRLIHLVNFTGEMTRPIRHVLPLDGVRVKLDRPAQRAYTLVHPQTFAAGREFTLPKIGEYEVLVVE